MLLWPLSLPSSSRCRTILHSLSWPFLMASSHKLFPYALFCTFFFPETHAYANTSSVLKKYSHYQLWLLPLTLNKMLSCEWFLFTLFIFYVYSFEKQSNEDERSFINWFIPQIFHPHVPHRLQGSKYLAHHLLPPRVHSNRKLDWKQRYELNPATPQWVQGPQAAS